MQIYIHTHIPFTYCTSHRTGIGLYEFPTPPSSSRTPQPSDQVKSKFLCLTLKILLPPICLSNFITNSPEPLSPPCSSLSPNIPAIFPPVCAFVSAVSELPFFPHYYQHPACLWGGRMVGRIPFFQPTPCTCHVTRSEPLSGTRYRFCFLCVTTVLRCDLYKLSKGSTTNAFYF